MKATMDNVVKPPMHNLAQKPHTSNLINKGIQNVKGQGLLLKNTSNMGVKYKYFLAHKIMVEATKWSTHLLMDSMDRIQEYTNESNLIIDKKKSKNQEGFANKWLDYFKM